MKPKIAVQPPMPRVSVATTTSEKPRLRRSERRLLRRSIANAFIPLPPHPAPSLDTDGGEPGFELGGRQSHGVVQAGGEAGAGVAPASARG